MKIPEKIYRLRTENNLTQVEFGKIAGATDKAVSTWERGEKEPRMKSVQKICLHFGIDLNKFIDTQSDVYKQEDVQNIIQRPATLSPNLKVLSDALDQLNEEGQEKLVDYADDLVSSGKYKKYYSSRLDQKTGS